MENQSQIFTNTDTFQEGLDIRHIVALVWHWLWIILSISILAAVLAYFLTARQTPYYRSVTTALVNTAANGSSDQFSAIIEEDKAITTYINMMETNPVLEEVREQLGLSMSLFEMKQAISISTINETELIRVTVETTDPQRSAQIANTLVEIFSEEIQDIQMARFSESKTSLESQIAEIESRIQEAEDQNTVLMSPEERLAHDTKLTQYRLIYSNLILSYEQLRLSEAQTLATMVSVEEALPNPSPVRPQPIQTALLAGSVGLLISFGVIFLIEYLDNTIRSPEEVQRKFQLPVLGIIHQYPSEEEKLISADKPRSPIAEAYRTLRTNVIYASVDKELQSILVTSPEPGEGKTTTVCNLGIVMAHNGKHVIIVDCDLRNPKIHKFFGFTNRIGISNLFSEAKLQLDDVIQATEVPGLDVVTTGGLPPNPSELLGSKKMQQFLKDLQSKADILLLDSPPTLAVTDAAVLAPSTEGVLMIAYPGRTNEKALLRALQQISQTQTKILGVVMNNVDRKGNGYGYRYYYYKDYNKYYSSDPTSPKHKILPKP